VAKKPNFLHRVIKASKSRKVILQNKQSPGDLLMLTAAVRDLKLSHPDIYVDVRTSCDDLWENNPYLTPLDENDKDVEFHKVEYPLIHNSNHRPFHFIHGFRKDIEDKLKISINVTDFKGDIHLSEEEKELVSPVEKFGVDKDFWILMAGGKYDFTAKWWNPEYYQQVVNHFGSRILFVQGGHKDHWHPKLSGVIDLVGKTSLREFIRLVYHSTGIITPVSFSMHLAPAVEVKNKKNRERPCVVIAGGREPTQWEAYPNHQFLSTTGCLSCCKTGGCWKSRCQRMDDKKPKDEKHLCTQPVRVNRKLYIPRCMDMIKPFDVIRGVELYHEGDLLSYHSNATLPNIVKRTKRKKILIASFQRSGTHFLINTLSDNLVDIDEGWIDVINTTKNKWVNKVTPKNLPTKIREQLIDQYYPNRINKCVKTHYQGSVLAKHIDELLQYYDIFYIIRDPKDNMVSCYNFYNKTKYEDFIKEPNFSKFLRKDISDARTETQPFSYSIIKSENVIQKWSQHVDSWLKLKKKGVHFIRYEDLKNDLEDTMHFIEENSSQELKKKLKPVPLSDKRYRPDYKDKKIARGTDGAWKKYFNFSDMQWLKKNLKRGNVERFYDWNYASIDVLLERYEKKRDFSFMQIGAFDGVRSDSIHSAVVRNNWKGILIEPQRIPFNRLLRNYKDQQGLIFENCAITTKNGFATIYNIPSDKIYGSVLKDATPYHLQHKDDLRTKKVKSCTFQEIIDKHNVNHLTFLTIDVEGYEPQLIRSIDFSKIKPTIIHFEKCHLSKQKFARLRNFLIKQGYIIFEEHIDATAILKSEKLPKYIMKEASKYAKKTFI